MKEAFSINNGKVVFDKNNPNYVYKEGPDGLYETTTPQGNAIYSLSEVPYNTDVKEVLLALKNGVESEQLDMYTQFIGSRLSYLIKSKKIDYIIPAPSSSQFLAGLMKNIYGEYNLPEVGFISLRKNAISEIRFNKRSHLVADLDREELQELKQKIQYAINKQIDDGNDYLEAKRFPKYLLPMLTNFFTVSGDVEKLRNANVLILDDNMSSGATIRELVDMFSTQYGCQSSGIVMFKITSA